MTTIRDTTAPEIIGEKRHSGFESDSRRIGIFLLGLAVVMTCMNLAAAIYLYQASTKVALAQRQLDTISSVEERLRLKLDLVNTGIQSQFDKLNSSLPARFNETNSELGKLRTGLASLSAEGEFAADVKALPATDSDPAPEAVEASADLVISAEPKQAPRKLSPTRKKAAPAPSASYQRTESADGLVHYRKIK